VYFLEKRLSNDNIAERGFITFDMIFAVIVVLFMLYVYLSISNSIVGMEKYEYTNAKKKFELLLLSEKLVKLDLAQIDGPLIHTHKLSDIPSDLSAYQSDFEASYLSVSLQTATNSKVTEIGNNTPNKYCIRRIILSIDTSRNTEIGTLDVCIG
jgi:hypothetical protein